MLSEEEALDAWSGANEHVPLPTNWGFFPAAICPVLVAAEAAGSLGLLPKKRC